MEEKKCCCAKTTSRSEERRAGEEPRTRLERIHGAGGPAQACEAEERAGGVRHATL